MHIERVLSSFPYLIGSIEAVHIFYRTLLSSGKLKFETL